MVVDNERKQDYTLIQICSCFASRNVTPLWQWQLCLILRSPAVPWEAWEALNSEAPIGALYIHAVNVLAQTCQILLFFLSSRPGKIIQTHSSNLKNFFFFLPPPMIQSLWKSELIAGTGLINGTLLSPYCSPAKQRHILPGPTPFPVQIPKSLLIVHFSIADSHSPTSWRSLGGKNLKVYLGNPLEAEVHPEEFCWMPSDWGASPLTFRPAEGSGEESPISSPSLQRQKEMQGHYSWRKSSTI